MLYFVLFLSWWLYDLVQHFISLFVFHARKSYRCGKTWWLIDDRLFLSLAELFIQVKNITHVWAGFLPLSKLRISDEAGTSCCQRNEESRGEKQNEKGEVELLSEPLMSPSLLSFYCIAQAGLESVLWNNVKSTHLKQQCAEIGIHWELSIIMLMPESTYCGIKYAHTQILLSTAFNKLACCLYHFWHHRSGTEEHLEGFVIMHEAFWGVHQTQQHRHAVLHKKNRI